MSPEQFCYWLQGFVELSANAPTEEQWQSVREHLQTVFKKVTPPAPIDIPRSDRPFTRPDYGPNHKIC